MKGNVRRLIWDVAQMFLLFQLQQMNTAWKTTQNDQTGSSGTGETGDLNSQLFAALFQELLEEAQMLTKG
jgi:hypothetical protein